MKLDQVVQFVESYLSPSTWTGAMALLLITVVVTWLFERMLGRYLRKAYQGAKPEEHPARFFVYQLFRAGVWLFAAVLYAHAVPALRSIGTALLASASVVSIVLGIAAQNTLGNLIAGASLLIYRPFVVGDRIQITAPTGVELGTVERISLGYTTVKTFDNRRIVLSNSAIANQPTINHTSVDPRVLAIIPVSISYTSDVDAARAILLELAAAHEKVEEVVSCPVVTLGASSVDMSLRVWTASSDDAFAVKFELLERAKQRFEAAGVEIPYPYQNVVLHQVDDAA